MYEKNYAQQQLLCLCFFHSEKQTKVQKTHQLYKQSYIYYQKMKQIVI